MWDKIKVILKDILLKLITDIVYKILNRESDKPKDKTPPRNDTTKTNHVLNYKKEPNVKVENLQFKGTIEKDFLFAACDNFFASNLEIVDLSESLLAHRDAIQVAPFNNDGYSGGEINSLTVKDVKIESKRSYLQGIFVGDGYIRQLYLADLSIETASQHTVTLTGVKTGAIKNCKVNRPIKLLPLRLFGGTKEGKSVWIIEDKSFTYDYIDTDVISDVLDMRSINRSGWNVYNVDSRAILDDVDDKKSNIDKRRSNFIQEALRRGAIIKEI